MPFTRCHSLSLAMGVITPYPFPAAELTLRPGPAGATRVARRIWYTTGPQGASYGSPRIGIECLVDGEEGIIALAPIDGDTFEALVHTMAGKTEWDPVAYPVGASAVYETPDGTELLSRAVEAGHTAYTESRRLALARQPFGESWLLDQHGQRRLPVERGGVSYISCPWGVGDWVTA